MRELARPILLRRIHLRLADNDTRSDEKAFGFWRMLASSDGETVEALDIDANLAGNRILAGMRSSISEPMRYLLPNLRYLRTQAKHSYPCAGHLASHATGLVALSINRHDELLAATRVCANLFDRSLTHLHIHNVTGSRIAHDLTGFMSLQHL